MLKHFLLFAAAVVLPAFFACQSKTPPAPVATPLTVTFTKVKKENCVRDSVCATLDLSYPVFSGGTAAATKTMNDSIQSFIYLTTGANPKLSLPVALDSVALEMFTMLKEDEKERGEYAAAYSNELNSKVLWQNSRYLSLEMNTFSFSGGAHGMYTTFLQTYDATTGKPLALTDIIRDTTAFRPMLENAFVTTKKADAPEDMKDMALKDMLLDGRLTMPVMYCVLPEGVRFMYNPYEVAAYAFGQTDIMLTWAQLGALADKSKWQ